MSLSISQKEMGKRIMELRKAKGLSQEELAKGISISRSSLVQIEQGNRYVDVLELHKLSILLEFSLDDFLSADFKVENEVEQESAVKEKKENVRISVPALQINKFKNVLLYILERCAGKPNVGETVLYKLLYFCDFNYYELYEEHLTGARYRKLPYGPVPQKLDTILNQMIEKGQLKRIKTEYFDKPQTRYIPLTKADLTQLSAAEKDVIDKVIEQMSDWNASTIGSYSHNDKPWKATEEGDYINYNFAFYRRPPYQMRVYEEDEQD